MIGVSRLLKQLPAKVLIILVIFMMLFITSCGGMGDWEYDLVNGYQIWRINSEHISLVKLDSPTSAHDIIKPYISSFCYNDRYVSVRWTSPDDIIDWNQIESYDFSDAMYYLFDTETESIYGPYETEAEFEEACEIVNAGEFCDWIKTFPKPSNKN